MAFRNFHGPTPELLLLDEVLLERYKTMTGQKPPKMDAHQLRSYHRAFAVEPPQGYATVWSNTVSTKAYCCTEPIKNLKRISISEMRLGIPAKGCYLLLRNLERPKRMVGVTTVVEDHTGDVVRFSAYNLLNEHLKESPEDLFPIGTVFALKEPLLKPSLDGGFGIRCDSPSDVLVARRHQDNVGVFEGGRWKNSIEDTDVSKNLSLSVVQLKELGNNYFRQGRFLAALDAYLSGLNLCFERKMILILKLNIGTAYLKMGHYESALKYCEVVLKGDPKNVKALYRCGKSWYELREYEKAMKLFQEVLKINPGIAESETQLQKCKNRIEEQKGKINLGKLLKESEDNPFLSIECAEYRGDLKIVDKMSADVTVVATCDIEPGTLLLVSKAIAVVFDEAKTGGKYPKLVQELAQTIVKNPQTFGTSIYDLPINDAFLTSVRPRVFCEDNSKAEPISDVDRIRRIVLSNGIWIESYCDIAIEADTGLGLFEFPSYIKHSCTANTYWTTFNDVLVMHSTRCIKAGEEVLMSRIPPIKGFTEKDRILESWGRRCYCKLCQLDRREPEARILKRENHFSKIMEGIAVSMLGLGPLTSEFISKIETLVKRMEETYLESGRSECRHYMTLVYSHLAHFYSEYNPRSKKPEKLLVKAIMVCGFDPTRLVNCSKRNLDVPDGAILSSFTLLPVQFLIKYYFERGNIREASTWLNVLVVAENIMTGADLHLVRFKYKHIPFEAFDLLM